MTQENEILDWDELSSEDKVKADLLLKELNQLFNKYVKEESKPCEDFTSEE